MFDRISGLPAGPTTVHEYILERTDTGANYYTYRFTVMGKGKFPLDMLRSDQCYPADTCSALRISRDFGDRSELREITMFSNQPRKYWTPTFDRWKSFGWFVKSTAWS